MLNFMRVFKGTNDKFLLLSMALYTVKLSSGRWGIFNGEQLLLTVGSQHTLDMILMQLSTRRIPVKVLSDS